MAAAVASGSFGGQPLGSGAVHARRRIAHLSASAYSFIASLRGPELSYLIHWSRILRQQNGVFGEARSLKLRTAGGDSPGGDDGSFTARTGLGQEGPPRLPCAVACEERSETPRCPPCGYEGSCCSFLRVEILGRVFHDAPRKSPGSDGRSSAQGVSAVGQARRDAP